MTTRKPCTGCERRKRKIKEAAAAAKEAAAKLVSKWPKVPPQ